MGGEPQTVAADGRDVATHRVQREYKHHHRQWRKAVGSTDQTVSRLAYLMGAGSIPARD